MERREMKIIIILAFVVLSLIGCDLKFPQYKYSPVKEEQAEIVSMTYVPYRSSTNVSPGISLGTGDLTMSISSTSFPEVWAVGFRCNDHHKTFILDNKEIFNYAKIGDTVTLRYVHKIKYYKEYPGSEEVIDQHTKQIIFKTGVINR
jgi:hypothetical protein